MAERRPNPSSTAPARLTTNHAVGSLAIALDGKRYAYTIGTEIWTADVTGGSATRFRTPIIETPRKRDLISIRVGGWFADGSLAVIGTTYDGKSQVLRAWPDRNELIETVDGAVQVAVLGDRIAVASGDALWLHEAGERHEQLKLPEGQIARLAWAADGKRLAFVVRISGEPERVAVETVATRAYHNVWSDDLLHRRTDRLLAWDGDRVLVSTQDSSGATLLAIDPVTREATARTTWPGEHVRGGAAAAGVLLVLRGNARSAVMVDELGMKPLHDAGASGSQLAGWTTDGRVVFVEGEGTARHIVRAEVGATEAWPATSAVDEPDTLANDVLLVHHLAVGDKLVIDRIARDGSRKELVRVAGDPALVRPVRCAGDRAPPCIVGQVEADHVQWTELDLETGALGNVVAERSRGSGDFAAVPTPDGTRIATVDGGPVISTLDRGTGEVTRLRGYGGAAFLEIGCRDDKCFATARGFEGRASSYVRAGIALSAESRRDDQREYVRVAPGPDRTIAVELVTYELDVWRQ